MCKMCKPFIFMITLLCVACTTPAQADEQTLAYSITRAGDVIGHHVVTRSQMGNDTRIDITTDIHIERFFIRQYAYAFSAVETWRDDTLVSLTSSTQENDISNTLSVILDKNRYTVHNLRGTQDRLQHIAPNTFPASLWNPEIVEHDHLFDTSTGELLTIKVTPMGKVQTILGDTRVDTNHFVISGALVREVWFDKNGKLLKMQFPDKLNVLVTYTLTTFP